MISRARRVHNTSAPGSRKGRPGRLKRGTKQIGQEAWDRKLRELLPKAPEGLKTLEEHMEWALNEMKTLYRLKRPRKHP